MGSHGIHAAAVHGREDVIDILIRHGANPSGLSMLPRRVLTDPHVATLHLMFVYVRMHSVFDICMCVFDICIHSLVRIARQPTQLST